MTNLHAFLLFIEQTNIESDLNFYEEPSLKIVRTNVLDMVCLGTIKELVSQCDTATVS